MATILLINGPNLGMLGTRKTSVYGSLTLQDIEDNLKKIVEKSKYELLCYQDECEGEIVRFIHQHRDASGAIINPGALMINGWSLRDALECFEKPWVEIHISNIWARESFRHTSVISELSSGIICGLGPYGYELAANALLNILITNNNR